MKTAGVSAPDGQRMKIAVLNRAGAPTLVSESSTVNGYSLLESPTRGTEDAMTDVDPAAAAKQTRELLERYVGLQPHEASNLSVVLYNADAAELPLATVRELSSMHEEGKLRCSVSVRHSNPAKLRSVYGELVNKAGEDPDLPVVSETSDNFISKLRISVTPISATPSETSQGFKAFDVAFLHDVVGQIFAMFVLTVAAAEAAVGLAILVTFFRNRGDIAVDDASVMKG